MTRPMNPKFNNALRVNPKVVTRAIATITQPIIQRLLSVPADNSIQLATDLDPSALITTFIIQNSHTNAFTVFLTTSPIARPANPFPCLEIPPGAAPVFQIPSQTITDSALVWDLTGFYLIGDDGFTGQTEFVNISAFPLPT